MPQSGKVEAKPADFEDLVSEDRLARAWEYLLMRAPGALHVPVDAVFDAVPATWIQPVIPGRTTMEVAVFAVAEPNPRFDGIMEVSSAHMPLEGWRQMETEAAIQHPFGNDIEKDPLVWCLFQALKGHVGKMQNLRAMSHPVTRIDEFGQRQRVR